MDERTEITLRQTDGLMRKLAELSLLLTDHPLALVHLPTHPHLLCLPGPLLFPVYSISLPSLLPAAHPTNLFGSEDAQTPVFVCDSPDHHVSVEVCTG